MLVTPVDVPSFTCISLDNLVSVSRNLYFPIFFSTGDFGLFGFANAPHSRL